MWDRSANPHRVAMSVSVPRPTPGNEVRRAGLDPKRHYFLRESAVALLVEPVQLADRHPEVCGHRRPGMCATYLTKPFGASALLGAIDKALPSAEDSC